MGGASFTDYIFSGKGVTHLEGAPPLSEQFFSLSLSPWTKYVKKFLTVSLIIVIEDIFRQHWYGSIEKKYRQERLETYLQFDTWVYRGFDFVLVKTFQLFLSSPLASSVTFLVRHRSGIIVLSSFVRLFTVLHLCHNTQAHSTWNLIWGQFCCGWVDSAGLFSTPLFLHNWFNSFKLKVNHKICYWHALTDVIISS